MKYKYVKSIVDDITRWNDRQTANKTARPSRGAMAPVFVLLPDSVAEGAIALKKICMAPR